MATTAEPRGGAQAEGSVYRPHERTSRLRIRGLPLAASMGLLVGLSFLLPLLSFGWPPNVEPFHGLPSGTLGAWVSGTLVFLLPALVAGALTPPLAHALGGRFGIRRAMFLSTVGLVLVLGLLVLWRLIGLLAGAYPVEGILLLGFGLSLWFREITVIALSHRAHSRSLPVGLAFPLLGMVMVWALLGTTVVSLAEGLVFLVLAFGGAEVLLRATDRPLSREFGQGAVSLLRPLMEHMSDRDPAASATMEEFFDRVSTEGDLDVGALAFRSGGKVRLALIAPSVHPGPFAELGSSDLPAKVANALRGSVADEVLVPHAPSTHAQDIPTRSEVERVVAATKELVLSARPGPFRFSPMVSPHDGSTARAQVLGDSVLVLLTQAPRPTDDIDYALGEMIRSQGRQLGFRDVLLLDAHNSFQENRGDVPFGSPEGFRLLADAKEAMELALRSVREGEVKLGVAHRRGFNPEDDGMGREGLCLAVWEAAGTRTALALFDANNLLQGLRDPLRRVLEEVVGGTGEVMTTDNHVVHEVQGGTNTLGERRGLPRLEEDVRAAAREAVASMVPVKVASAQTTVHKVRVLGPGVVTRLMTALADSFALFWLFFLASITLVALAGALLLAFLR